MMNEDDYHRVTRWLEECHRPLLFTHSRPDGDGLGALVALDIALRRRGLAPEPVIYEPIPNSYTFLEPLTTWRIWADTREVLSQECDAVVILDTCALAQLEPAAAFLASAPRMLVIDHHATHDPIGLRDGDLRLFDDTASAASLMVAEWIRSTGLELDEKLATALFTGLAADTGWFRFSNTDARTMRTAADLVDAGVDPSRIHSEIYQRDPPEKLRLVARLLENLEMHADGKMAVMTLREADFQHAGADRSMTEDLVNEATRLAGTEATLLFTEESGALIRVNFRSKQRLDVSEIARRYGGGGHARAAGARLNGQWDKIVPNVIAETAAAL